MELSRDILDRFVDPQTREPLINDQANNALLASDGSYSVINGVINFYTKTLVSRGNTTKSQSIANDPANTDAAPELRSSHEAAFQQAAESGGNIYGRVEDLPLITQSGHYRRMKMLSDLDLGDIEDKTVVDFGTGPWGFGAIFPKLRSAKQCIGFDVSVSALEMARNVDSATNFGSRVIFATSEGEVIPLADSSVDVFFGGEVIEHVRNPRHFLQEIARVCKDKAIVILTTPNREAIFYRIANIPYCVGPEHIALLSHGEFRSLLDLFMVESRILGYETSLGPGLDNLPIEPDACEMVQRRACEVPELSSGMISRSVVSKTRFSAHRTEYSLEEILHSSPSVSFKSPAKLMKLFGDVSGALLLPDNVMTFPAFAREVTLLFWGHDWSGIVEIILGGVTMERDLYSLPAGFIRIDIALAQDAETIKVRPTGRKREASLSNEVIFYKAMQYVTR
jgi:ubiquinone/menaquinone biosynthesis C-methylase UbiE